MSINMLSMRPPIQQNMQGRQKTNSSTSSPVGGPRDMATQERERDWTRTGQKRGDGGKGRGGLGEWLAHCYACTAGLGSLSEAYRPPSRSCSWQMGCLTCSTAPMSAPHGQQRQAKSRVNGVIAGKHVMQWRTEAGELYGAGGW